MLEKLRIGVDGAEAVGSIRGGGKAGVVKSLAQFVVGDVATDSGVRMMRKRISSGERFS